MDTMWLTLIFGVFTLDPVVGFLFSNKIKLEPPGDVYLKVPSSVNITCKLQDSTNSLRLTVNNRLVNVTQLNQHTIMYTLTSNQPNTFKIMCSNSENDLTSAKIIKFGYPPNGTFWLVRDINDFLWLTFDLNLQTNEYRNVNCTTSKYPEKQWKDCVILGRNETTFKIDTNESLYFKLRIIFNNHFGKVEVHKEYLKSSIPVQYPALSNVIFETLSSQDPFLQTVRLFLINNGNLGWTINAMDYKIRYSSEFDGHHTFKEIWHNSSNITLEQLAPYTLYDFKVWAKPADNGIWNVPIIKQFKTKTMPSLPVFTTNGSYCSSTCSKTSRCLILYWQKVPPRSLHGKLTGYCVQHIRGDYSEDYCLDPKHLTNNTLSKEFRDLPPDEPLKFSISVVTHNKQISQPTFIQIHSTVPAGPPAVFAVRLNKNEYNVSWTVEPEQQINNVTVFHCKNKKSFSRFHCEDYVKWNTVNGTSSIQVRINTSLDYIPNFAAYFNTDQGSSSLTFSECVFTLDRPNKPPKLENLIQNKDTLTIPWPDFKCDDFNGIPVAFQVLYSKYSHCDDNGEIKSFEPIGIKPPAKFFNIQSVEGGTTYSVCIRVKTERYLSSLSDAATIKIKSSPSDWKIPVIVIAALFAVAVISGILYFCRWWNQKNIEIEIPRDTSYEDIGSSLPNSLPETKTKMVNVDCKNKEYYSPKKMSLDNNNDDVPIDSSSTANSNMSITNSNFPLLKISIKNNKTDKYNFDMKERANISEHSKDSNKVQSENLQSVGNDDDSAVDGGADGKSLKSCDTSSKNHLENMKHETVICDDFMGLKNTIIMPGSSPSDYIIIKEDILDTYSNDSISGEFSV
ncbi:uncharacterized protein LOC115232134 [Argonauta hians]